MPAPRPLTRGDTESIRRCPKDDTAECRTRSEAKGLEIVKGGRKKDKMEFVASGGPCVLSVTEDRRKPDRVYRPLPRGGAAQGEAADQDSAGQKSTIDLENSSD